MAGDDKKADFPDLDDLIMDVFKPDLFKDMSMSDFGKGVVVGALASRVSALTLGALAGVAFGIYMEQTYKVPDIRKKVGDLLVKKDDKKD
ncbi:Hypp3785 [Branchiostoma lanceolatum]|uniref:Hypp3785 protein n=1 Tax=Branchiostoma lanceolatum TaxID=7740 RepID=A0A8K0A206_BRALA|nr:Hypp3785 [Branchiostoma lanceolatum]